MALKLINLDTETREQMIAEIDLDKQKNVLYASPRLKDGAQDEYENLLREAVQKHDDAWLAEQIRNRGLLKLKEPRIRKGKTSLVSVPTNANEQLAEGEFNRFYMRGLCSVVLQTDNKNMEVYRAKQVSDPRPDSEAKIGQKVDPRVLRDDLRKSIGTDTALGLPAGPNSGLSVKREQ